MTAPRSTYRLQIRPGFTLDDAVGVLDYLVALGVDAVYLSPLLTSTTGSQHGYDVTDPTGIDPQRGGEDGLQRFLDAAAAAGPAFTVARSRDRPIQTRSNASNSSISTGLAI